MRAIAIATSGEYPWIAVATLSTKKGPKVEPEVWAVLQNGQVTMRNVFIEKWPSLVKCGLMVGAALFIVIRGA